MESITIKVEDDFAKEIEKAMHPYYTTKTEFIREAIRDKVKQAKKQKFIEKLEKYRGIVKTQTSDEELERIREKLGEELIKEHEKKLK